MREPPARPALRQRGRFDRLRALTRDNHLRGSLDPDERQDFPDAVFGGEHLGIPDAKVVREAAREILHAGPILLPIQPDALFAILGVVLGKGARPQRVVVPARTGRQRVADLDAWCLSALCSRTAVACDVPRP
jgi:hypothetical protein